VENILYNIYIDIFIYYIKENTMLFFTYGFTTALIAVLLTFNRKSWGDAVFASFANFFICGAIGWLSNVDPFQNIQFMLHIVALGCIMTSLLVSREKARKPTIAGLLFIGVYLITLFYY
jgi:drug/metabolite transporter superfamily protein YnfA